MRVLLCLLFILSIVPQALAYTEKSNLDGSVTYTVTLTPEEYKTMGAYCVDIGEWIENAVKNRARIATDEIVTQSGKGSQYSTKEEKNAIIKEMTIVPLKDRNEISPIN